MGPRPAGGIISRSRLPSRGLISAYWWLTSLRLMAVSESERSDRAQISRRAGGPVLHRSISRHLGVGPSGRTFGRAASADGAFPIGEAGRIQLAAFTGAVSTSIPWLFTGASIA